MPTSLIGVTEGDFRFAVEPVEQVLRRRWPEVVFVPATGRIATVRLGQFQLPGSTFPPAALVEVDVEGQSLTVNSGDGDTAAEVIAAATHVPAFPADGSVIVAEWAPEFKPLRPDMTGPEVLALLG